MYKIGIRIDGNWRYYLIEGFETVESIVSKALKTQGFEKLSIGRMVNILENKEEAQDAVRNA